MDDDPHLYSARTVGEHRRLLGMADASWDKEEHQALTGLIEWMQALEVTTQAVSITELRMGRAIAELLHHFDMEFFDTSFLTKVLRYDENVNYRLRATNIRKIISGVREYYDEKLGIALSPEWQLDDSSCSDDIAMSEGGISNLLRLIYLVVYIALYGPRKKEIIESIQTMRHGIQSIIANIVTEVRKENGLNGLQPSPVSPISDPSRSSGFPDSEREELEERLHEVEKQKEELSASLERAQQQIAQANEQAVERESAAAEIARLEKELRETKTAKNTVEDQLMVLDGEQQHLKEQLSELQAANCELIKRVEQLAPLDEKLRVQRDELEEYRQKAVENRQLISQLDQARSKLKEGSVDKGELQMLREKCDNYVKRMVELEEENDKLKQLRPQLGKYKATAELKEQEAHDLAVRVDRLSFELAQAEEKIDNFKVERQRWQEIKADLEEKIASSHASYFLERHNSLCNDLAETESINGNLKGTPEHKSSTTDLLARLTKVEMENDRLRARDSDELRMKDEELDSLRSRIRELEAQNRVVNQQILQVKADLDRSYEENGERSEKDSAVSRLKVSLEMEKLESEKWKKSAELAALDTSRARDREELLRKQIEEEQKKKQELEEYLQKAKDVIDTQDKQSLVMRNGGCSLAEFNSMRREIESKDKRLNQLEAEMEQSNKMHEQEQRLVSTTFYQWANSRTSWMTSSAPSSNDSSARDRSFFSRQRQQNALNLSFTRLNCFFWGFISAVVLLISVMAAIFPIDVPRLLPPIP